MCHISGVKRRGGEEGRMEGSWGIISKQASG